MCDFIFEHRERQRKKHFCLLRCLSAFATPIKLYFRCVFKLLPYVALALWFLLFFMEHGWQAGGLNVNVKICYDTEDRLYRDMFGEKH